MLGQIPTPKSLCILRLSAIGDVCHAVAMVQQIQAYYPEIKITWIIGKVEYMLLKGLLGVEFIVFDKSNGIGAYKELRNTMKNRYFDVLFHMQIAFRASLASLCIPAKIKVGFDRKRAKEGQWLFSNKKISPQTEPHVLDGFMGFADTIGVSTQSPTWHMPFSDEDRHWAKSNIPQHKPYAVICAAASNSLRNWHAIGYARTAEYLIKKGYQVVLCGGPTDLEKILAAEIECKSDHEIVNLVGKTNLKQLLAVLENAKLVISPDTGPVHMATTVDTPVIGLYAHSNPKRTGPYLSQEYIVSVYDECIVEQRGKPLKDITWGIRAKGNLMDKITFEMVQEKIDLLLK